MLMVHIPIYMVIAKIRRYQFDLIAQDKESQPSKKSRCASATAFFWTNKRGLYQVSPPSFLGEGV